MISLNNVFYRSVDLLSRAYCNAVERQFENSERPCFRMSKIVTRIMKTTEKGKIHNCASPYSVGEWKSVSRGVTRSNSKESIVEIITTLTSKWLEKCPWKNSMLMKIKKVEKSHERRLKN